MAKPRVGMKKPLKIEVYDKPFGGTIVKRFTSKEELEKYAIEHNTSADCVVINNCVMLGWDELEIIILCTTTI
jgi:hypothetical protein